MAEPLVEARVPVPPRFLHLLQTGASFPLANKKIFPSAIKLSINYPVLMARLSLTLGGALLEVVCVLRF